MARPDPRTAPAFIALGANLGDRAANLRNAVQDLDAHPQVDVVRTSPVYETAAHTLTPGETQPPYLNAVVLVDTTLSPRALLAYCHDLERRAGRDRRREPRWAARTLDLDLLVYDDETCATPSLTLPHPRLSERRFVLVPLADLAPEIRIPPPFDATVATLLARCPDPDVPVRVGSLLRPECP